MKCISVVIPFYNASNFILKAINSVKDQTILPKELILIDDGSSDNTYDIVKDLKLPFDFRLLRNEKNIGRSYSRNLGVKKAKCDFVAFLDADDMYLKNHLEILSKEDAHLIYSIPRTFIDKSDNIIRVSKKSYPSLDNMILGGMVGYPSGIMVKKETFLNFDETLHQREDWELFLRYYKNHLSIKILDQNTTCIREHRKRTSKSKEYFYYTMMVYERYKDMANAYTYLSISETAFRFKEKSVGFEFLIKALKQDITVIKDKKRLWEILKRIPKL